VIINREWAMPNSKTFKIKPIKEIIQKYVKKDDFVLDPFANENSIKNEIKCKKYISNDLDENFDTDYHLEAQDFMKLFEDNSVDVILFDPPYSGRQVAECYKKLNKTVTMNDTNSGYFTKFKKEISRILKPNGICITCCWNTNGIGQKYGFEIIEILDVAHGSMHNDTLITVEKKIDYLKSKGE
jgi:DNA modification methylase